MSASQKYLDTALSMFAQRGFYGVSLADVAEAHGVTKQAVLYHFKTKEALYGAVLADVAARYERRAEEAYGHIDDPDERYAALISQLKDHSRHNLRDVQLIIRELLDNPDRAVSGRTWYLRAFLDEAVDIFSASSAWTGRSRDECRAGYYQLIGAVHYFTVSQPTLDAIWGDGAYSAMARYYSDITVKPESADS